MMIKFQTFIYPDVKNSISSQENQNPCTKFKLYVTNSLTLTKFQPFLQKHTQNIHTYIYITLPAK